MKQLNIGIFVLIGILSFNFLNCECAHILFVHTCITHSHMVVASPIINSLHSKGHKITIISTHQPLDAPSNRTNYEVIIPKKQKQHCSALMDSNIGLETRLDPILSRIPAYIVWPFLSLGMCEAFYSSEEIQQWLKSNPQVDLMFMDTMADCPLPLRHKLGAKLILLNFATPSLVIMDSMGIPFESIPFMELGTNQFPMSFSQRVMGVVGSAINKFLIYLTTPKLDEIAKKYLGDGIPSIAEMIKKDISLMFHNGHQLEDFGRSFPPNVISIPGIHVRKSHSALDKKIEEFIGSQKFVYISLGTAVDVGHFTDSMRSVFFNAIKNNPSIQFLWKWDAEIPKDVPKNLYLAKWFNQQDVLGHKNILGFVTQAGRPSLQEAMYNYVPMIAFPVLGDQDYNAAVLESLGVAIKLEITTVMEMEFSKAISELPRLQNQAKRLGKVLKDTRFDPLDTAIWWTEYLIRQENTGHLISPLKNQNWIKRRQLDIWGLLFLLILIGIYFTFESVKLIRHCLRNFTLNTKNNSKFIQDKKSK